MLAAGVEMGHLVSQRRSSQLTSASVDTAHSGAILHEVHPHPSVRRSNTGTSLRRTSFHASSSACRTSRSTSLESIIQGASAGNARRISQPVSRSETALVYSRHGLLPLSDCDMHEQFGRIPQPVFSVSRNLGTYHGRTHNFDGIRKVEVVAYQIVEGKKPYATFRINVQRDARHWTIHRRFSDFEDLHDLLLHMYPASARLLSLPSKRYIKRVKFDHNHLEQRRNQLGEYLNHVMSHPHLVESKLVRDFLGGNWRMPAYDRVNGKESSSESDMSETDRFNSQMDGDVMTSNAKLVSSSLTPRQAKRIIARTDMRAKRMRRKSRSSESDSSDSEEDDISSGESSSDESSPEPLPSGVLGTLTSRSGPSLAVYAQPALRRVRRDLLRERAFASKVHGTPLRPFDASDREPSSNAGSDDVTSEDIAYPTSKQISQLQKYFSDVMGKAAMRGSFHSKKLIY